MGCNGTATGWDWVDGMLIAHEHLKMLVCVCVCVCDMCCTCTTFGTLLDAAKRRQTVMINIDGSKWHIYLAITIAAMLIPMQSLGCDLESQLWSADALLLLDPCMD